MDHIRILRRALSITWNYRLLWAFGILVALTTGGGGGGPGSGGEQGAQYRGPFEPPRGFSFPEIPPEVINVLIAVGVGLICLVFVLALAFAIINVVARTALIRLVDRHEETGERSTFSEGFRLGWSRAALRIFLIDLFFGVISFVIIIGLIIIALLPLLAWFTRVEALQAMGTVLSVALFLVVIFIIVLYTSALSILSQFFHRAAALENLGVFDSIRRGWQVFRARLGDAIIMGLILFALSLAYAVVAIPIFIILLLIAGLVGGVPGLLAGLLVSLFAEGALPIVVGLVVALPIFILLVSLPLLFINGLVHVFASTTWTLTYREMVALEGGQPAGGEPPVVGGPSAGGDLAEGGPSAAEEPPAADVPPARDEPPAAAEDLPAAENLPGERAAGDE